MKGARRDGSAWEHGAERGRKVKKAVQTNAEFHYNLKEVARNKTIMFRNSKLRKEMSTVQCG